MSALAMPLMAIVFCTQLIDAKFDKRMIKSGLSVGLLNSGIIRFAIREDGGLEPIAGVASTHGTIGAHIYAEDGKIWCANYINGTVIAPQDILNKLEEVSSHAK